MASTKLVQPPRMSAEAEAALALACKAIRTGRAIKTTKPTKPAAK
jgi:hypothetical protein